MISERKTDAWVNIVDESINADVSRKMNLFLQVGNDFFTAGVLDTDRNKFVALLDFRFSFPLTGAELNNKLLSIIDENKPLLDNIYDAVIIGFSGFKNTLVPDVFFDTENAEDVFAANHPVEDDEIIRYDNLRRIASKNVYALPSELYSFFSAYYSNLSSYHAATPFIEGLLAQHKNTADTVVTVNVQHTFFELVVNRGGNLVFYNQFRYQTAEDFIYYIVFVYEQLGLNPETQPLVFSGLMEKNSSLLHITRKYIRNISFVQRPAFCFYSYGFDNLAAHYHFSLYNQFLCV